MADTIPSTLIRNVWEIVGMEKLIYLVEKTDGQSFNELREGLLADVKAAVAGRGGRSMIANVADIAAEVAERAPQRLIGPVETVSAVVEFWLPTLDERGPVEQSLSSLSKNVSGYLVTESLVQGYERDWRGEERPGVTQFGANGKPANVSDNDFYHSWQILHSKQSFDLHPLRWSYVRNSVARQLTEGPAYRAIVLEHFRELDVFCDDERYFGGEEALQEMMEHAPGFLDFNCMVSVPMREYHLLD